jgi:WD40 repeat protein
MDFKIVSLFSIVSFYSLVSMEIVPSKHKSNLRGKEVRIFDMQEKKEVAVFQKYNGESLSLICFSDMSTFFVIGLMDNEARLFDIEDLKDPKNRKNINFFQQHKVRIKIDKK